MAINFVIRDKFYALENFNNSDWKTQKSKAKALIYVGISYIGTYVHKLNYFTLVDLYNIPTVICACTESLKLNF